MAKRNKKKRARKKVRTAKKKRTIKKSKISINTKALFFGGLFLIIAVCILLTVENFGIKVFCSGIATILSIVYLLKIYKKK